MPWPPLGPFGYTIESKVKSAARQPFPHTWPIKAGLYENLKKLRARPFQHLTRSGSGRGHIRKAITSMGYVPGFDQDIFISYAQVDNEPMAFNGREIRWVSHLKEQLQRRIDQKLGRTGATKIWMDLDNLAGNQAVTPAIDSAISKTAVLVSVLSYGYLSSVWHSYRGRFRSTNKARTP